MIITNITRFSKLIKSKCIRENKDLFKALNKIYKNNWYVEKVENYLELNDLRNSYYNNYIPEYNIRDLISESTQLSIIIHYPELVIKSSGPVKEHIIRDLYIRIRIRNNKIKLEGRRGGQTLLENYRDYGHSHLINWRDWSSFCLGDGPLNLYTMKDIREFKEEDFSYVLHLLDSYLKWESLSGGPYRDISTLYSYVQESHVRKNLVDKLYKLWLSQPNILPNIKLTDKGIHATISDEVEKDLSTLWEYELDKGYYKAPDGSYLHRKNVYISGNYVPTRADSFYFKNKQIQFKLYDTDQVKNFNGEPEYTDPAYTKAVIKKYSEDLTRYYINNYRNGRKISTRNKGKCNRTDKIPMLQD